MIDKGINAYKDEAKKSYVDENDGLDEAKKIGKWIKSKTPKKQNPTAQMRVYREDGMAEGGLIIDSKFIKNAFNEETRKYDVPMYRIWVRYDGGVIKEHEVSLATWTQINEFETVEGIKIDKAEQEMIQGVGVKPTTKSGYAFSNPGFFGTKGEQTGETFDFVVKRDEIVWDVKRANGEIFTINASKLNI